MGIIHSGGGIQARFDDTAYVMSGNIGLQLILQNKKNVLIGTHRHEELLEVLKKLGKAEELQN